MRIIIAGVPGAGKTSIMKEVSGRMHYQVINYGTVMLELAKAGNMVKDRDEIRKLPINLQHSLQKEAAKKIGRMNDVIVDTHLTIKTLSGYFPGLPMNVLEYISPDVIVIVEAEPSEILLRRKTDVTRKRDLETIVEVEEHLEANRYAGFACSVLTGAPLMILKNHDGMLDESVKKFMGVFK